MHTGNPIFRFVLGVLCGAVQMACAASPAPPVRTSAISLPERRPAGSGHVAAAANLVPNAIEHYTHAEVGAQVSLVPDLALDAALFTHPTRAWMGSVGVRVLPVKHPSYRFGLAAGAAVGCGIVGERSCDELTAGGAYVGIDLGGRFNETAALFLATRYQLTSAQHRRLSQWLLLGPRLQIDFADFFGTIGVSAHLYEP